MARIVILAAIIAIGLILWYKISSARGEERKKLVMWTVIGAVIAGLVILAATGKLNWITAAIAGVVAMIPRLLGLLKFLPLVERFTKRGKTDQQSQAQTPGQNGKMSQQEALDILGLKPGATREDIFQAHKRMIQKLHPDRGGSDHLAAQINKAKDTLLG